MFTFKSLANFPLAHSITSIEEGNIDLRFSDQNVVVSNLQKITSELSIDPDSIVQAEQIHATKIALVSSKHAGQTINSADGLITNSPDVSLLLRVADCAPIIIYDSTNHALGLVHSGWRGTIGKISLVAVQSMMHHFGSNPANLFVCIGPCIDKQILDHPPMQSDLPEWKPFISSDNNVYIIDLLGFITQTLEDSGVESANIQTSGINTVNSDQYFSYQRSKSSGEPDGRFAVIAKLNKK